MASFASTDRTRSGNEKTLSETSAEVADKAGRTINRAMESAEATADDLIERGREAKDQVEKMASNLKSTVTRSVRSEPIATLAVAAVMGFVLGALWKS